MGGFATRRHFPATRYRRPAGHDRPGGPHRGRRWADTRRERGFERAAM